MLVDGSSHVLLRLNCCTAVLLCSTFPRITSLLVDCRTVLNMSVIRLLACPAILTVPSAASVCCHYRHVFPPLFVRAVALLLPTSA